MLALVTHEPHFKILREDVFAQDGKQQNCYICGQPGHQAAECQGKKPSASEQDDKDAVVPKKPFIFLHVNILREYLAFEMSVPGLPFRFDLERAIDDWVFMCFFVGNDFLPHLPSLEIREGAIDSLISIYKKRLPEMGGYLTENGEVCFHLNRILSNYSLRCIWSVCKSSWRNWVVWKTIFFVAVAKVCFSIIQSCFM